MSQQSDDWRIKLRSQIRKQNINMLAWQENNPNPMTDEDCDGLIKILKTLTEKVYSYRDNIRVYGWVKHTTTIPLDDSKILEQQKFLEQHQNPEVSGN